MNLRHFVGVSTLGAWACLTAAACGYSNEGQGSQTLLVKANLSYMAGQSGKTDVLIDISRDDQPVHGAKVALVDDDNQKAYTVTETGSSYQAHIQGYHRRLFLSVEAGKDNLSAQIEGPGIHRVTAPLQGEQIETKDDLVVKWSTNDGVRADEVFMTLEAAAYSTKTAHDDGSYTIAESKLARGTDKLTVLRRNSLTLAGGVEGSSITMSYGITLDLEMGH